MINNVPVIDLHLFRLGSTLTPFKKVLSLINSTASQFIEQMEEKGIIYCLHCISTGVKYVGQTKRSFNDRLRYHKYGAEKSKNKKNPRAKLYIQVNKTGWEDFICGIIDEFNIETLDEKECFYIEKYDTLNNGLNTAPGGGFFPSFSGEEHPLYGVGHTEETKKKISKNHHDVSGEKNPNYGKKWNEEWKQKRRDETLENHPSRGTFWWNNGKEQIRSKDKPGDDFIRGRLNFSKENNSFYGKKHSEESKRKMSENHPDVSGENHPMYGRSRNSKIKAQNES
jgi:group I intron endonuclease